MTVQVLMTGFISNVFMFPDSTVLAINTAFNIKDLKKV